MTDGSDKESMIHHQSFVSIEAINRSLHNVIIFIDLKNGVLSIHSTRMNKDS